jgi:tetratricopeptide (TPR) repeat protein
MDKILKGIGIIIGVFILLALLGALFGSHDFTTPTTTNTIISGIGLFINYIIQNALSLIAIVLLIMFYLWIRRRDDSLLILPFEIVNSESKYNGKAISDLIIAELQRIKHINNKEYKVVEFEKIEFENLEKIPKNFAGENTSVPQLGTVDIGSASFSIGELMSTIKRLYLGDNYRQILKGSIDNDGSKIKLVAFLMGNQSYTWEVQEDLKIESQGDNQYSNISDLVRDLSFRIAYDLSHESISAKTLLGFRYYTEALDNYQQYILTLQNKYLECARLNCINAIKVEPDYGITLGLFFNLGSAYLAKKKLPTGLWLEGNYDRAIEMFNIAIEVDPQYVGAWIYKGITLFLQDKKTESTICFNKANNLLDIAIDVDPQNVEAWTKKGYLLAYQDKFDEAFQAYDKAIEITPQNAELLTQKGISLYIQAVRQHKTDKYDDAIKAYDKAIEINPRFAPAWQYKGFALEDLGRTSEANAAFAKAKELGYTG